MKLCTIQAIGEVVLYARGFVGFDYGSAVTDKTEKTKKGEKNEEHYKCRFSLLIGMIRNAY